MSLRLVVVCDFCGRDVAAAQFAKDARKSVIADGGLSGLPGGRDACGRCVRAGRPEAGGGDRG